MPFVGELSALGAATLWAGSSIIFTNVTVKIGPIQANMARMVVGTVFFLLSILIFQLPINLSPTQISYLALSGFIGLVFGDTFLFKAFQTIGARLSMLIMSLAPAIAATLAYICLGETISLWGIWGILITLCGISLVVFERTGSTPAQTITKFGILYAFLGALGQGVGLIFAKMAFAEGPIHGIVASCLRIGTAIIVLLPVVCMHGRHKETLTILRRDRNLLRSLLTASFFGVYFGITLSLLAVAYAKVGVASTLISTSPVLMLPMLRFSQHETFSWRAIVGAVVAVAGIAILFLT